MNRDKNIVIEHISGTCKYHRKVGQKYKLNDLTPDGLCPHAYFAVYPYVLGMLHDVQFDWMKDDKDHVFAHCPALVKPRILEICRTRNKGELNVYVKVKGPNDRVNISNAKECDCPHCAGESFKINKGDGNGFCPAAFHQLFPYMRDYLKNQLGDFLPHIEEFVAVCPDNCGNIIFKFISDVSKVKGVL